MTRQIGYVLGVSILVAVLGVPSRVDPVAAFDRGWVFMIIAAGLGAVAALCMGTVRGAPAPPVAVGSDAQRSGRTPTALASPQPLAR